MNFQNVIDYIDQNLYEDLNLDDVARRFFYSTSHFSRVFSKETGKSFVEYITNRRLSRCAVLLRNSDLSVEYIAHTNGFNSQKYFSHKFKSLFDVSPTEYRRGKKFIVLTLKRQINRGEGNYMKLAKLKEMLFLQVNNRNQLLDLVSQNENMIIYSDELENVQMIFIDVKDEVTTISELEVNVVRGIFDQKTIFEFPTELYEVNKMYYEDKIYIEIMRKSDKKTVVASLYPGKRAEVDVMTATETDIRIPSPDNVESILKEFNDEVKSCTEHIIESKNQLEVKEYVDKQDNMIILKEYGSEFLILKLLQRNGFFTVVTIYADLSKDYISAYQNYSTNSTTETVELKLEKGFGTIYCDGVFHARCFIYNGEDKTSSIHIQFPSMSGVGNWDISNEF